MRQFNRTTIEEYNNNKGVTLLELLIAISIFALIVVGFSSIDTFSRYHLITSDKKAKLQNDASYVLEHMAKEINKAIGDVNQAPIDTSTKIAGDDAIRAWIDYNQNGKRDTYPTDRQIAYRFTDATGPPSGQYQIWYYSSCVGPNCNLAGSSSPEVISSKISLADLGSTYSSGNDYVEVQLTACDDPDGSPVACGGLDNLSVNMKNRISMPAVSTN